MWDAMLTCPSCTGNRGERFKAPPSIPPPRSESLVKSPNKSCRGFGRHTGRDAPPRAQRSRRVQGSDRPRARCWRNPGGKHGPKTLNGSAAWWRAGGGLVLSPSCPCRSSPMGQARDVSVGVPMRPHGLARAAPPPTAKGKQKPAFS